MLTPSLNAVMTRLLIVAAVLAALVFFAPAIFAQGMGERMTVMYDENDADAVITFTSTDPENGTPGAGIDWDVTGLDADDFMIDEVGMLMFKSPPDFEKATDRARVLISEDPEDFLDYNDPNDCDANVSSGLIEGAAGTEIPACVPDRDREFRGGDNHYQITVRATEQVTEGADVRALSTETDVTVIVENVEEPGTVTINRLQPEVGTQITATLSDPDGATTTEDGTPTGTPTTISWQWYVSTVTNPDKDVAQHWIPATGSGHNLPVAGSTNANLTSTYIPHGNCVDSKGTDNDGGCPVTGTTVDNDVPVDEGKILRAVASYTDSTGQPRTAIGVTMQMYPVRAEVSSDLDAIENPQNGSPGFSSTGDYSRTVPENTPVGSPVGAAVTAIDPNDDTLTYDLDVDALDPSDGIDNREPGDADPTQFDADLAFFSIDKATGQLMVAKTLDYDDNMDGYEIYVRATDPSGETAHVKVTVTATDANDAPDIMSLEAVTGGGFNAVSAKSELRVDEKDDDPGADPYDGSPGLMVPGTLGEPNVFIAIDDDARGQVFWSLTGDDAEQFVFSDTDPPSGTGLAGRGEPIAVVFKEAPDYENPTDKNRDSVYKVTVVVDDRRGGMDERSLTIFVDNVGEVGKATLSDASGQALEQPHVGEPITAAVVDPDNGVAVVTWQWERATSTPPVASLGWEVIDGATNATYTPRRNDDQNDIGYFLRATATYTDITSDTDDMDTVRVDERTQKDPTTPDTPEAKVAEVSTDGTADDNLYRVRVVSDNAVRLAPTSPTPVDAPQFSAQSYDRMVVENAETGSIVGEPIRVVPELDADGDPKTTFSYDLDETITNDNAYFTISTTTGQIRVGEVPFPDPLPAGVSDVHSAATSPDMDDPVLDYEGDNTFTLRVTATDRENSARTATADVNITLIDLNERPYFDQATREMYSTSTSPTMTAPATTTYAESRTNSIAQLAAIEPDLDQLRWEVTGPDADNFMIDDVEDIQEDIDAGKDRVNLVFRSQPDFENLKGSATTTAVGDTYLVTVRATETSVAGDNPDATRLAAELDMAVQVTNSQEPGSVEVRWLRPEVGTWISATTTDPDGGVDFTGTDAGYQWYRAKVTSPSGSMDNPGLVNLAGEWEMIPGATDRSGTGAADVAIYLPTVDDVGLHLLARAVYADNQTGATATTTALGMSAFPVRANVTDEANNSPDFNTNAADRSIAESAAVGDPIGLPVDVDRNEDGDDLTYELVMIAGAGTAAAAADTYPGPPGDPGNGMVDTEDVAYFSIDKDTGQIRVAKTLSAENNDDRDYAATSPPTAGKYTVVVRATDPSGEGNNENRDDIVVTITATNVNEAPSVRGEAELSVNEVDSSKKDSDVTKFVGLGYELNAAGDAQEMNDSNLYHRDEEDAIDRATWPDNPIAGRDGRFFEYSVPDNGIGRRLHFKETPDYESPMDFDKDNVYEVTITVMDRAGDAGTKNIRITVMNVNEAGTLKLSPEQPDDGMPVIAELIDPDGVVSITDWQWAATTTRSATSGQVFPDLEGVFNPDHDGLIDGATTDMWTGEVGEFLHARVYYRDGASVGNHPGTALDERNDDPGTPVSGAPGADDTEQHKYATTAADERDHNSDETLMANASNAVQPDPDPPTDPDAPATGVVPITLEVYENVPSTGYVGESLGDVGKRDTIGGPDGAAFVYAEDNDQVGSTYYDSVLATTTDAKDKVGQLALKPVTHLDYETKPTYVVEVSDPDSATAITSYLITINVLDVNDAPTGPKEHKGPPPVLNTAPMFLDANGEVATTTTRMVAENSATGTAVGMPVMATDTDRGDTVTYTLGGTDAASFTIGSDTGQIMTSADLDYETKMTYMVTVTATDEEGETAMIDVTINVTNVGLDNAYDMDDSGDISRDEVIQAINDYLAGVAGVTRDDVIALINLYLAG